MPPVHPRPRTAPSRRRRLGTPAVVVAALALAGSLGACGSSAPKGTGGEPTTVSPVMMNQQQMDQLQKTLENGVQKGPLSSTTTSTP